MSWLNLFIGLTLLLSSCANDIQLWASIHSSLQLPFHLDIDGYKCGKWQFHISTSVAGTYSHNDSSFCTFQVHAFG